MFEKHSRNGEPSTITETPLKDEDDPRRHNHRCIHFDKPTGYCKRLPYAQKCFGSARCDYYLKEPPYSILVDPIDGYETTAPIPEWLKAGETVTHKQLGKVIITNVNEFRYIISLKTETGTVHENLDLQKLLNEKILTPIFTPLFEEGSIVTHSTLGKVKITKITTTHITVIDQNEISHILSAEYCYEHNLLSKDNA